MCRKIVKTGILTRYETILIVNEIFLTGFKNEWVYI